MSFYFFFAKSLTSTRPIFFFCPANLLSIGSPVYFFRVNFIFPLLVFGPTRSWLPDIGLPFDKKNVLYDWQSSAGLWLWVPIMSAWRNCY